MTDIEEKDISPKDQHSKEVSERSSKTFDGTKHKEEPPSKRQRAESGAVVFDSSPAQKQQHACKQEPDDQPPPASVTEHKVNYFDNVASDHVVKQEESNSPLAETLKESSSAIGAVVKQEKEEEEEEEDQEQQLNDVPGNAEGVEEEVILEWEDYRNFNCDLDEEAPTLSLSVDKMLQEGKTLTQTDAVNFIEPGEWQERRYTMKLIKNKNTVGKQEEKTSARNGKEELAWISFYWWKDNDEANLMNFNQLSQEMADFCYILWRAARRNRNHYNDMAIEFGDSPYSYVPLSELIDEAIDDGGLTPHVAYIDRTKSDTSQHGKRLMDSFVRFVGYDSNLIAHETDFMSLKIYIQFDEATRQFTQDWQSFEFIELLAQKKKQGWYIRAGEPELDY